MAETRTWTLSGSFNGPHMARVLNGPPLEPAETIQVIDAKSTARIVPVRDIIANKTVRKTCGGISNHTLIAWRAGRGRGRTEPFPAPIRRCDGTELWDRREVRAWLRAHPPTI